MSTHHPEAGDAAPQKAPQTMPPTTPHTGTEPTAQELLEALPGLVYVFDLSLLKTVYINCNLEEELGYDPAYLHGLGSDVFTALVHPDDIQNWVTNVLPTYAAAADKTVIENEFRMRHANGEWRWFLAREHIWRRTPDGRPQQIVALGQDITLRKESQRRLDRLLRHATEGLSLVDAQGNVIYSSPSVRQLFDLQSGSHRAGPYGYRFTERVHVDDRARAEMEFRRMMRQPGAQFSGLFRTYGPEGTIRWAEVSAANLLHDPDAGAIVVNYRDVTERMRTENQLQFQSKLLENVNDAVIVTDLEFVVQTWNRAAQAIYGWTAEEIMGRSLGGFVATQFVDDSYDTSVRIARSTGNWHGEVLQKRKDGSVAHILASISLVRDAADTPVGWVAINRDISEEKAISQALVQERTLLAQRVDERTTELRNANEALIKAAQLKDEFLAAVSHEFRTPLQAILGFTESLSQGIIGPLSPRQAHYMGLITENGNHLLALINDLLEFTKRGASPTHLELTSVVVSRLCDDSLDVVRCAATRKRLHIALALDNRDQIVAVDERIVKQILVNLLSNAVKFTAEGGTIGLESYVNADGRQLCFTVWDTGIGIHERDRNRLFQPFVQLDSGLNRQYEGTGLGLALSARLANVHGGEITLESTPGVGSRFTLALPMRPPQQHGQRG